MPELHAPVGPSKAAQWMACTPSIRMEEGMPDKGSPYAAEGTLAHHLGELLLRERWEGLDITAELAEVQADPLYSGDMGEYLEGYADFIEERMAEAKRRCPDPSIYIEQRVDVSEYIPEGFGTTDCAIIADDLMDVIDLKYGTGVPVSAEDNPQMKIYGLGCYLAFSLFYDIQTIRLTIYQPRLDSISVWSITVMELLEWAERELKPKAALAWAGEGECCPGEKQCRWCKAAPVCKALAAYQMELARYDFAEPRTLNADAVADVLDRLPGLTAWAKKVSEYALDAALTQGVRFPNYKVVEGRSNRRYADEDAVAAELRRIGYKVADIYKPRELLGITAMEKLVGKKRFGEVAGAYLVKPEGAPTLVPESDKRPELNTAAQAAEDFKEEN
nr:MAG TPA: Protein of unknown function (DUF2800) [Caudoviricetes sp.]